VIIRKEPWAKHGALSPWLFSYGRSCHEGNLSYLGYAVGQHGSAFTEEKLIVLFQENAPEELAEYCVLHRGNYVADIIQANDVMVISGEDYKIVGVGDDVQTNLQNLGHITLRFDGSKEGLGGSVYLEDTAVPTVQAGDVLWIYRQAEG
jgi:glucitol/sorbitol PTS system EIIA component